VIALTVALALAYTPQEAQALFTEANDAYYRQEYPGAIEKYQRLLQANLGGPDVLFNLGTAHLAANELGPAVLFLTRASRLSHDDDIVAQLAVAQQRQLDQVVGVQESAPFLQRLAHAADERLVSSGFIATWWLAFVLLFVLTRVAPGRRWILGLATASAFFVSVAFGTIVGVQRWVTESVQEAVVMAPTAGAREFPGDTARVAFEVHAGLLVRVMEDTGRFVRIRLPNALEGWLEKSQIAPL
jgi:hypothetical protein